MLSLPASLSAGLQTPSHCGAALHTLLAGLVVLGLSPASLQLLIRQGLIDEGDWQQQEQPRVTKASDGFTMF